MDCFVASLLAMTKEEMEKFSYFPLKTGFLFSMKATRPSL